MKLSTGSSNQKLSIKPFKQLPTLPTNYDIDIWNKLKKALDDVKEKKASEISKEELYQYVENLCIHKFSSKIYNLLISEINEFINNKIEILYQQRQISDHSVYLTAVDREWNDFYNYLTTVRNIFLYLDRTYAVQTPGVLSLWDHSISTYQNALDRYPDILMKLVVGILANIDSIRRGFTINVDLINRLIIMLISLNIYKDVFERTFLESSRQFYLLEGQQLVNKPDSSIDSFISYTDRRVDEANYLADKVIHSQTKQSLIQIIEQNLFAPNITNLLDKDLSNLLTNTSTNYLPILSKLYILTDRVNLLDATRSCWGNYLKSICVSLVVNGVSSSSANSSVKSVIEELIVLYEKMDEVLKQSFQSNESFKQTLKNTIESSINHTSIQLSVPMVDSKTDSKIDSKTDSKIVKQITTTSSSKIAELMARHVDKKLRGEKGMTENDIDNHLDKVMHLFKLLDGKDVFEAFYKKLLAKRLLLSKSASYELEKNMLLKLKSECGSGFTSKLEGMFQDIDLSRDIMNSYSNFLSTSQTNQSTNQLTNNEPETNIQVLTTGYWPAVQSINELVIPLTIQSIKNRVESFYLSKYQGRRLTWTHSLDRCIVVARFDKSGKKELEISFYQALVLLTFNDSTSLTCEEIRLKTGIEEGELKRLLQSLANGPKDSRVLVKEPKGREVESSDFFSVVKEIPNRLYRIKISSIQLKETNEDVEKTHEEIFRDRQYQVDAAIVRIMKARKRLPHNQLIGELLSQLKFPANSSDLKKRIESLIEREYMERDKDNNSIYQYLA